MDQDFKHASAVPLVRPPPCVPVHPPLDAQMCGILQQPDILDRGILLCFGCFSGCRLKGKDKDNFSFCHGAELTPLSI